MCVDAGVPRRPRQTLILAVRDVRAGPTVAVLLREAEIDDEHLVAVLPDPHQEVVRLHVAVDEVFVVHVLDARDHLVGEHEDGLLRELAPAEVEQVLEAGTEQLHHEHVVVAFVGPEPLDARHADAASEDPVDLSEERREARLLAGRSEQVTRPSLLVQSLTFLFLLLQLLLLLMFQSIVIIIIIICFY